MVVLSYVFAFCDKCMLHCVLEIDPSFAVRKSIYCLQACALWLLPQPTHPTEKLSTMQTEKITYLVKTGEVWSSWIGHADCQRGVLGQVRAGDCLYSVSE